METSLTEIHPTQDQGISTSLLPCTNGQLDNRFVNRSNSDSIDNSMLWADSFDNDIKQAVGKRSYHILHHLLDLYLRNVTSDAVASRSHSPVKFRDHTLKVLMFFHFFYHDVKDVVADHNFYLDKMSEIIEIYVDTELRASKISDPESLLQISAKLISALYIYLDNSEEHVLRVLFRMKVLNNMYSKIYHSILRKCCTNMNGKPELLSEVTYVRYLFALKLWKKTCEDPEQRKQIDELALKILGPRIPNRGIEVTKSLPFLRHKSRTLRLMKQNSFDLRTACEDFIAFERRINAASLSRDGIDYNP